MDEQLQALLAEKRKELRQAKREQRDKAKAIALDNGILREVDKARKHYNLTGDLEPLMGCYDRYGFEAVQAALGINASQRKKWRRVMDKMTYAVMTGNAYSLTLTFRPAVLDNTNEKSRRDYARKYLKSIAPVYVGNIDFGDKEKNPESNEREHYHAVAVCGVRPPKGGWPHGFSTIKKVGANPDDLAKVCKYVVKLSMHALKASTTKGGSIKCPRLIYSRNCLE